MKVPVLGCSKCRWSAKGCKKCRHDREAALQVSMPMQQSINQHFLSLGLINTFAFLPLLHVACKMDCLPLAISLSYSRYLSNCSVWPCSNLVKQVTSQLAKASKTLSTPFQEVFPGTKQELQYNRIHNCHILLASSGFCVIISSVTLLQTPHAGLEPV